MLPTYFQMIYGTLFSSYFKLEELIAELSPLSVFDEFGLKICGYYCKLQCINGFPSLVLDHWSKCLTDEPSSKGVSGLGRRKSLSIELEVIRGFSYSISIC